MHALTTRENTEVNSYVIFVICREETKSMQQIARTNIALTIREACVKVAIKRLTTR